MCALLQTKHPPTLPLMIVRGDCPEEKKQGRTSMSFHTQLLEVYRVNAVHHLTLLHRVYNSLPIT